MKVYVATKNEKKINLVKKVFLGAFPSENVDALGCEAESDVSGTPQEDQTYAGAKNRAVNSKEKFPDGDYYVGIETGLIDQHEQIFEETWCCILNKDNKEFWGYSSGNVVPSEAEIRKTKDENTQTVVLEVFNNETKSWKPYSGFLEIRELELENAIRVTTAQLNTK